MTVDGENMELGDAVSKALATVGVTEAVVEKWLGRPCHCEERRLRLNALSAWARRVVKGKTESAHVFLRDILSSSGD